MRPSGVQAWLREQGRGFAVGPARVPIVPGAILFDLAQRRRQGLGPLSALSRARLRGRGRRERRLRARQRRRRARRHGPSTSRAASARPRRSATASSSAALAAVNAFGSVVVDDGPWFWAAPFEIGTASSAGAACPSPLPPGALDAAHQGRGAATPPSRGRDRCGADQGAGAAPRGDGAGRARAGDLPGAHAARRRRRVRGRDRPPPARRPGARPHAASARWPRRCVARAVARGVYEAEALPGRDPPSWRGCFRPLMAVRRPPMGAAASFLPQKRPRVAVRDLGKITSIRLRAGRGPPQS